MRPTLCPVFGSVCSYHSIEKLEVYSSTSSRGSFSCEALAHSIIDGTTHLYATALRLISGEYGAGPQVTEALFRVLTCLLQLAIASASVVPMTRLYSLLLSLPPFALEAFSTPAATEFLFLLFRLQVELGTWQSELDLAAAGAASGMNFGEEGNPGVFDMSISDHVNLSPDGKAITSTSSEAFGVINFPMKEVPQPPLLCASWQVSSVW